MLKKKGLLIALGMLSLAALACGFFGGQQATPTPTKAPNPKPTAAPANPTPTLATPATGSTGDQPVRITGSFEYTNDFIFTYYSENMVALVDMNGFITRDMEWEIPVDGQILGYMTLDLEQMRADYQLDLPAEPRGNLVDVDQDDQSETGVQVFAVSYWPNLVGSPYSVGDDRSRGWPNYLASVITDTENKDEVIGGKLVVWAPDGEQEFPTGYGEDGLLFTEDDPAGSIPAGFSVVDLDQTPFAVSQEKEPEITLYEPQDVTLKDFSDLSYSEAFKQMFDQIRLEYAFNDIEDKAPDWDALWSELEPRVAEAEQDQDPQAFYLALRDYTYAFKDGHVGLSGGDIENEVFAEATDGGYGFAIGETDDQRAIVIFVVPDGPADAAGIKVGAEIITFNDKPVSEAIGEVKPLSAPFSTDFSLRYQQARYLLRAPVGTEATLTYKNPETSTEQDATLEAVAERDSFSYTSVFRGFDPNALPVEFRILDSGVGYVKINSNFDDLNLIIRLFERALQTFSANQVPGVIIDMRQNSGGANLGLAGFLTDQEIELGQLEYFSENTGQFEPEGVREKVFPNENQYSFPQMALLVSQACASACEIEAYGFSQVPGMIVVGTTPSGGVEAEVARGQYLLPENMSLQVPTGRFTLPDGSIFLEGVGVEPTLLVPATPENLLSQEDVVLQAAEDAVLEPPGSGVEPSGSPVVSSAAEARQLLEQGTAALEDRAREQYDETSVAGETYTYTVALQQSEPLLWLNGWCAADAATLEDNYEHIQLKYILNGEELSSDQLASFDFESQDNQCRIYYTALDEWPAGEHHLQIQITFDQVINDGNEDFPKGTHTYDYTVVVKP